MRQRMKHFVVDPRFSGGLWEVFNGFLDGAEARSSSPDQSFKLKIA